VLGHQVHECVWFVFSVFLQKQLDEVRYERNTHYIRKSKNNTVRGIPDVNFFSPSDGFQDQQIEIQDDDMAQLLNQRNILEEARTLEIQNMEEDLNEYFEYVVASEGLPFPPSDWAQAKNVFRTIIDKCFGL